MLCTPSLAKSENCFLGPNNVCATWLDLVMLQFLGPRNVSACRSYTAGPAPVSCI